MKKLLLSLTLCFALCSASAQAKDSTAPAPIYTVSGDVQAFETLLKALDASTAPNIEVQALKRWIIGQVQAQIKPPTPVTEPKKKKN